jgi:hypothetical protein
MKTFDLYFSMDNDAFEDDEEVSRILTRVAKSFSQGSTIGTIHDSNGNSVGEWSVDLNLTVEDDA